MEELGIHVLKNLESLTNNSVKNYIDNERSAGKNCFVVFPHEWETRSQQIEAHVKSYNDPTARKYHARKCVVKEITFATNKSFCHKYHIQGSNKLSIVAWGIFHNDDLLGVLSLGRHHRQGKKDADNDVVLDRMCFKHGVRVQGGASKLFKEAVKWAQENDIDRIVSFSDNRFTTGNIYERLNFTCDSTLYPDYFYVDKNDHKKYISKQSQKKSNTGCPPEVKELDWAIQNGLMRVYDGGKKRWVFHIKGAVKTTNKSVKTVATHRDKIDPTVLTHCDKVDTGEGFILDKLIIYKDGAIKVLSLVESEAVRKYCMDKGWGHEVIKHNIKSAFPSKMCAGKDSCGRELPIDRFGKDNSKSDGRCRLCKECRTKKESKRYHDKKAKI